MTLYLNDFTQKPTSDEIVLHCKNHLIRGLKEENKQWLYQPLYTL